MKKLAIIILTITFGFSAFGQIYEPQILILKPNDFKYEKEFDKEVKSKNKELFKRPKNSEQSDYIKSDAFKKLPDNFQQIF